MPTMAELGRFILDDLNLPEDTLAPFRGNLEAWLSFIAEPQPWLSEAEVHDNTARFLRASHAIANAIAKNHPSHDFQNPALSLLAEHWAGSKSHIITFNYDLIVEQSFFPHFRGSSLENFYEIPLVSRRRPGGLIVGPTVPAERPHLYKLHGSVNWRWGGEGDERTPATLFEPGADPTLYLDLREMVIPPTSSKSMFYSHRGLRAQWSSAATQLTNASRLIVIGYSLPPSDLQVHAMLSTALRSGTRLIVVDRNEDSAKSVADRLNHLHLENIYSGDNCVHEYALSLIR